MKDKFKRIRNQTNVVFKSKFLKNFSPAERYEFLQLCHRRKFKEGEYVFYRNDPGTGMYFIEEGSIELTFNLGDDSPSDIREGFVLESSDSFGALSIGYDLRRKSSAKCLSDSTLLGFFKPDFEVLMERHPAIAVKFLQTLTNIALRQLETAQNKIEELSDAYTAVKIEFDAYYEPQKE
ncbi:MAG: cyclic nucleotide-binding domain-containing protein [bacterium]|jgi:CRP-like cAMP-binding protein|nr:cyclic nucleotide-binding domain-containing protein [bacterium]